MAKIILKVDEAVKRMGNAALYKEIALLFAARLPQTALEIKSALAGGAWKEAMLLAHSLKSNCAAIGSEESREASRNLEMACLEKNAPKAGQCFALLEPLLEDLRLALLEL